MEPSETPPVEPAIDEKVVARLSSRKAEERAQAEQTLEHVSQEQAVADLLALLEKESVKKKKRYRFYLGFLIFYVALMVLMAVAGQGEHIASFSGMFGAFASMAAATQLQKNAVSALAKYDDLRGVGALAESLDYQDKKIQALAEEKLTQMLPRLRASDADYLNEGQRKILCRALFKRRSPALALAILKAFEQVGDEMALEYVERVANGEGLAARDAGVRTQAQDCLPALRQRAELARAARILLRPAEAPGSPADILLRPAMGTGEVNPDLLLRPAPAEAIPGGREETGQPARNLPAQDDGEAFQDSTARA